MATHGRHAVGPRTSQAHQSIRLVHRADQSVASSEDWVPSKQVCLYP
jgi:hypothetical protein